ncbi:hypothetical protein QZH41_014482 [Actinostola sp. cb2023]|nr:hypothetical protein QZH41_014482 [Actinostola sp. cb2023]
MKSSKSQLNRIKPVCLGAQNNTRIFVNLLFEKKPKMFFKSSGAFVYTSCDNQQQICDPIPDDMNGSQKKIALQFITRNTRRQENKVTAGGKYEDFDLLRSQFKTEPKDRTVTVGNSVTLKCNPPRGKPTPTVSWLKDGLKLKPDGTRVHIVEPGSLYISIAQKVDQGRYVCQATNPLGQRRSTPARLTVKELPATALNIRPKHKVVTAGKSDTKPVLGSSPINQTVKESQDAVFTCKFDGIPVPTIQWHKDKISSSSLRNSSKYVVAISGSVTQLKIKSGQKDDEGLYICTVTNILGNVYGMANLVIKRTTTALPQLITTIALTTTTTPILPAIFNKLSAPSELFPGSISTNNVLLLWTSVNPGNLPITYTVEFRKSGQSSRKWKAATESIKLNRFFVKGLEPGTLYEFSVRAKTMKTQSKRTIAKIKTKVLKRVGTTIKPIMTRKLNPAKNANVLVNIEPVKSDKLNITWKFDRHIRKSPSGFYVFWKEEDSSDGYNKIVMMGDGVQEYLLNGLSANTSYVIQIQVFFSKHTLPKSKSVAATTGTRVKLQIAEIQRPPASPQGHKTLWMDDVNTTDTPPQQPANNRISDTSSTECLNRSVTSCCARRGLNTNADFPNKITLNSLSGSHLGDPNQFDVSTDSKLSEGKTNNVQQQQSINNYREHINKTAKFDEVGELGKSSIGSRSGSEATLPRAMPQQTSFLAPTQQFINRKKANTRQDSPAFQQKDPNQTPDDTSITEKTKPKLKIQSFEMASNGSVPGTTTFHTDPPPTYEAVLKETELEKQLEDGKDEEITKSKEDLAERLKGMPFSGKPVLQPPSPPLSERSCKTTSSCGSRKRKVFKPPPRLAILNWADLLPPPPSHPPPSSLGSPPPSPPFSLRSGMSGMSGLTGMSGMTGLTGMTGMTGRTGKSSANGIGDSDLPERFRKRPGPPSSAVSDSLASAEPKPHGSTKSKSSKHKKPKPKAMPIDLEGITSDIIMQWADSVTNTSGSDDDSSCSSPSRVSSTGSFFTDTDFANAVRAAAECGGFNMETYGLMDSLGYPPPYSGSWKRSNSVSNGSDPSGPTMNPRPPNNRNKWETGSEGDLEFTPPITVRPRFTRRVQLNDNGAQPIGPSKMAADMGIRKVARSPVPIVPSQPRRPVPRAARNPSNSPVPGPGQIVVQPLKKTSALGADAINRAQVTKKFAIVKKIPQSKDAEYNSATLSSSGKSSTSTASTVKTSTMGDSDAEVRQNELSHMFYVRDKDCCKP